jgi:hypothetical protein
MADPIDGLTDQELKAIEKAHAWVTGTSDAKGRVLGRREKLFEIPEKKIIIARERIGLAGKTVVEFGSLEGAHTISLCREASRVITLEIRDENIEKTKVRCALYSVSPEIIKMNLETEVPPEADLYFHSGVFYHLQDPVGHLLKIMGRSKDLFLDTHYAPEPDASYQCAANGKVYPCWIYPEPQKGCKAGVSPFSRWLQLSDISTLLTERFRKVEIVRNELENNIPRATFLAMERIDL